MNKTMNKGEELDRRIWDLLGNPNVWRTAEDIAFRAELDLEFVVSFVAGYAAQGRIRQKKADGTYYYSAPLPEPVLLDGDPNDEPHPSAYLDETDLAESDEAQKILACVEASHVWLAPEDVAAQADTSDNYTAGDPLYVAGLLDGLWHRGLIARQGNDEDGYVYAPVTDQTQEWAFRPEQGDESDEAPAPFDMLTATHLPNGAQILTRHCVEPHSINATRWLVLCSWERGGEREYVTWLVDATTGEAYWGHYHDLYELAQNEYERRKKNALQRETD